LIVGSSSDVGVQLIGTGKDGSVLIGTGSGWFLPFTFSKGNEIYNNIERVEGLGGISVKATRNHVSIVDCRVGGTIGIEVASAFGASVHDCAAAGNNRLAADGSPGSVRGVTPGTIGLCLGNGIAGACRFMTGWEITYALSVYGSALIGCSTEVCGTGVRVGWSASGETPSHGASIQNLQTERCNTSIDLYNATGCFVAGNWLEGGAIIRDSPDESQTGTNVRVFPALLQDRREVLTVGRQHLSDRTDAQRQASFGGIVAGGGSNNHYKVRYDGTNWVRVGWAMVPDYRAKAPVLRAPDEETDG
jgi:hypothetical protein